MQAGRVQQAACHKGLLLHRAVSTARAPRRAARPAPHTAGLHGTAALPALGSSTCSYKTKEMETHTKQAHPEINAKSQGLIG